MSQKKTTTVSIKNTPVQRALARAKKSTLLLLLVGGLVAGYVYKQYFAEKTVQDAPATVQQQGQQGR